VKTSIATRVACTTTGDTNCNYSIRAYWYAHTGSGDVLLVSKCPNNGTVNCNITKQPVALDYECFGQGTPLKIVADLDDGLCDHTSVNIIATNSVIFTP
jgi:hypothetical protein